MVAIQEATDANNHVALLLLKIRNTFIDVGVGADEEDDLPRSEPAMSTEKLFDESIFDDLYKKNAVELEKESVSTEDDLRCLPDMERDPSTESDEDGIDTPRWSRQVTAEHWPDAWEPEMDHCWTLDWQRQESETSSAWPSFHRQESEASSDWQSFHRQESEASSDWYSPTCPQVLPHEIQSSPEQSEHENETAKVALQERSMAWVGLAIPGFGIGRSVIDSNALLLEDGLPQSKPKKSNKRKSLINKAAKQQQMELKMHSRVPARTPNSCPLQKLDKGDTKFCSQCGFVVRESFKFCNFCGASLVPPDTLSRTKRQQTPLAPPSNAKGKAGKGAPAPTKPSWMLRMIQ